MSSVWAGAPRGSFTLAAAKRAYKGTGHGGTGEQLEEEGGPALEGPEPSPYALSMDTLAATKALESKGFSREQAEALVGLLHTTISSELVTKAELTASEARLTERIAKSQVAIEHSLGMLTERLGTVEAQFSKLLAQELRKLDERISTEAAKLNDRISTEVAKLDGRITQEIRRVEERMARVERDVAVQGVYVKAGVVMIAAVVVKVYWEPLVRAIGALP